MKEIVSIILLLRSFRRSFLSFLLLACCSVRTAPVRGAPGPTPSPHKNGRRDSTALVPSFGLWSTFWKPRIDDPLSIIQ